MKGDSIGPYWVAMPVMRNLILLGAKNETDLALICKAGGIGVEDLNNMEMRLSLEANIAIMEAIFFISGDKNMGLHLGEKATPPTIGQVGHFQLSSSDVLTAFKKTVLFTRTFTALYDFIYEEKNDKALFYFEPVQLWNEISPETARQCVDIPFTATLNFIKVLSGKAVFPIRISYRYSKLHDTFEHERMFQCRPLFNQSCNCIAFKKKDLEVPVLGYNPQLNAVIEKMLYEKLRSSNEGVSFCIKVKEAILANYQYDFPRLETIAVVLNVTPRTLQRKLQEENSNYRTLSDTIKLELASILLKHKELSIADIAFKLGYADSSTFRKAFKQWSGAAPIEYRKSTNLKKDEEN